MHQTHHQKAQTNADFDSEDKCLAFKTKLKAETNPYSDLAQDAKTVNKNASSGQVLDLIPLLDLLKTRHMLQKIVKQIHLELKSVLLLHKQNAILI